MKTQNFCKPNGTITRFMIGRKSFSGDSINKELIFRIHREFGKLNTERANTSMNK
jgi:hypothetical protein